MSQESAGLLVVDLSTLNGSFGTSLMMIDSLLGHRGKVKQSQGTEVTVSDVFWFRSAWASPAVAHTYFLDYTNDYIGR